jgi:hypothetical protein
MPRARLGELEKQTVNEVAPSHLDFVMPLSLRAAALVVEVVSRVVLVVAWEDADGSHERVDPHEVRLG